MDSSLIGTEELKAIVLQAAAEALNEVATEVYIQSQIEVPKGLEEDERHTETLAQSGRYPGNDPNLAALPLPEKLEAQVIYLSDYAGAQHEGYAVRGDGTIWEVTEYTTPGTKKKYLEDPHKAVIPSLEARIGIKVNARLEML